MHYFDVQYILYLNVIGKLEAAHFFCQSKGILGTKRFFLCLFCININVYFSIQSLYPNMLNE